MIKAMLNLFVVLSVTIGGVSANSWAAPSLTPVRLQSGVNPISNIAGDGKSGSISLGWRDNGNAWGYNIFTVMVGNNIVTHEVDGKDFDQFRDSPHTGDDMITSVRFARGVFRGRKTLMALVANRDFQTSIPDPAIATITIYALIANNEGVGTPYQFTRIANRVTKRSYCNADMALKTELGFPLNGSYSGPKTADGC